MITSLGGITFNYGAAFLRLEFRACWEAALAIDVAFAIISVVKLPQVRAWSALRAPQPTFSTLIRRFARSSPHMLDTSSIRRLVRCSTSFSSEEFKSALQLRLTNWIHAALGWPSVLVASIDSLEAEVIEVSES